MAVQTNRKVVYLLWPGTILGDQCFVKTKKGKLVLKPNNYTVAFEAHGSVFTFEIVYEGSNLFYVLSVLDPETGRPGQGPDFPSAKHANPSASAKEVFMAVRKKKLLTRPNGQIYVAVGYENLQVLLRQCFRDEVEDLGSPLSKEWLGKGVAEMKLKYPMTRGLRCVSLLFLQFCIYIYYAIHRNTYNYINPHNQN